MRLQEHLARYCATNPSITSERTVARYKTTVANFERWLGRDAEMDDLTPDNWGLWIQSRRGERAAGTIRGDAEKLRVIWKFAAAEEGLPEPRVKLPPSVQNDPVAWRPKELAALERAARECDWRIGGMRGSVFWPALIGVAVDTGERINAIHSLESLDIDLGGLEITFRRDNRKGKRRTLRKGVSRQTAAHVAALLRRRPEMPFAVVQPASLYPPLRRLLADAGLPRSRTRMFHCLRRTHATYVHLQGGDATASLGHADPRTTRGYIDTGQLPVVIPNRLRPLAAWLARIGLPSQRKRDAG